MIFLIFKKNHLIHDKILTRYRLVIEARMSYQRTNLTNFVCLVIGREKRKEISRDKYKLIRISILIIIIKNLSDLNVMLISIYR